MDAVTRGVPAVPTKLYNLEILQYNRNGTYQNGNSYGTVELGTHLDVTLNVMNDCQLLVVARGNKDAVKTLVGKNRSFDSRRYRRHALCAPSGTCKRGDGN